MPQRTKADVTVDFDPHASTRVLDPAYIDTRLQRRCPVAWSEEHGGFWYVTEYENASRVMKDYKAFSSCNGDVLPPPPYSRIAMVYDDPPVHAAYRRALNPLLSREAVEEEMVPRIRYWTDVFLDRVIESGRCDLMYDLAVPIPAAVTLEWLGFEDPDEWFRIGDAWHNFFSRSRTGPHFQQAGETIIGFDARIAEELAARREQPRDDIMSRIVEIEIDGAPLSEEDAVGLVRILIGAGTDTTTTLLGSAFVHLHFNPDDRRRLMDEPELLESATEEFLRRYPPARTVFRTCVQDSEMDGFTIKAGDQIVASILGGNLEDEQFENPDAFIPDRSPNRHLSFGMGVHRCLGMHLGRAEFINVMEAVFERIPDFAVLEDEISDYVTQATMMGWRTVPATFTPGTRKLPADEAAVVLPLRD